MITTAELPQALGAVPGGLSPREMELRREFIGASEVASILDVNPWESARSMWYRKVYGIVTPDNPAMARGRKMEPYILREAADTLGVRISRLNRRRVHPNDCIQATVDAWVVGRPEIIEAKKVMWFTYRADPTKWGEPGGDCVPDNYQVQAQTQLAVVSASSGVQHDIVHLAVLIGDDDFRIYKITRHQPLIDIIERKVPQWCHDYLFPQVEPPSGTVSNEVLSRLPREQGVAVDVPLELITAYETKRDAEKLAKDALDEAKDNLILSLGTTAEIGRCGNKTITYKEVKRSEFTTKASTYRTLRIATK